MNSLQFCPPELDAFLAQLAPLWTTANPTLHLVGDNPLAEEIAEAAQAQGVNLLRGLPGAGETPQWLVFTETDGERLAAQLITCVGLRDVTVLAPITDQHFSRRPLFLISIPKSGTHLLYELARALGYHEGVVLPEFPRPQTWYCVEYSNSHTVAADFFVDSVRRAHFGNRHHAFMASPALFMYRHPLDVLVSEAHYYERDGKTAFAGWLSGLDTQQRIARLLDDNWLLGSLRQRIGGFLPWLDFPNVAALSFEELIGAAGGGQDAEQQRLIWSIQLKLQAPGSPASIAARLFNPESATFRSGQIGGFQHTLAAADIQRFVASNQDLLSTLGYPLDGTIALPSHRQQRQATPLRYSHETFDDMPLLIESDVLGCNLVRYRQRLYAVPQQLGTLDLRTLSAEQLNALPCATLLSELKALLLLGKSAVDDRRDALRGLAKQLTEQGQGVPVSPADTNTAPQLLTTHNGYNIFHLHQRFLGLRQAAGPVDLCVSLEALVARYPLRDLLTAATLEELIEHIDGVSMTMRLEAARQETERQVRELERVNGELRGELDQANERVRVLETKVEELGWRWWRRL